MNTGRTGASVTCNTEWKNQRTYLATNKEVLDEELYGMGEALGIALRNGRTEPEASRHWSEPCWMRFHIWVDS